MSTCLLYVLSMIKAFYIIKWHLSPYNQKKKKIDSIEIILKPYLFRG